MSVTQDSSPFEFIEDRGRGIAQVLRELVEASEDWNIQVVEKAERMLEFLEMPARRRMFTGLADGRRHRAYTQPIKPPWGSDRRKAKERRKP